MKLRPNPLMRENVTEFPYELCFNNTCQCRFHDWADKQPSTFEIMKTRSSKLVRLLSVLFLAVWAAAPRATAQSRPSLGLRFSAGQPTLSLTGTVGTVYS